MPSDAINTSAKFYGSALGKVNAQIIGNSCAAMNLEMLEKYGRLDSAIFMGLGDGSLLELIGQRFEKLIVLEASDLLVTTARERFAGLSGLQLVNSYFEAYEPEEQGKVSCILGNHVLEHPASQLRQRRPDNDGATRRGLDHPSRGRQSASPWSAYHVQV